VHPPGPCPDSKGTTRKPQVGVEFEATGSAGVAFAEAKGKAQDAGRQKLVELRIQVKETGSGAPTQLAKLHSVVPATQDGAAIRYDVELTATLDVPEDTLRVTFHGTPPKYQPLREALRQAIGDRDASLRSTLTAAFEPALELAGQEVADLQQRATDTGPDKCTVTIVTEEPNGTA
jgi:hypothetical protein